ncbi:MAG: hypothetical protein Q7S58_05260 [Candidatus Binatus sp.]|uniref:choice-of-anchor tandem repeat GloVer-containing protein n=1 Tax=Candidatus Binatus sp. TaxID=2811406 RepID=UPI00271BD7F6|nr:choice-of-anchor tandem repeat GloVer-containing protein [Candidatus Binatus sp.]MDO8431802.1 hypothetical protein [Candidatus Binatus sp.]
MRIRLARVASPASATFLALQLIVLTILLISHVASAAQLPETVIRSFGTGPGGTTCTSSVDGAVPKGSLTFANGFLFGRTTTTTASTPGDGIIFHVDPDGNGYDIDHVFTGAKPDGNNPRHSAMTLDGMVLYGTTLIGGKHDNGTIFSIKDDGSSYSGPLLDFQASSAGNNGDQPHSCFALNSASGLLYGMTSQGGTHGGATGDGTIFSFDPSTSAYTRLFSFDGTKRGADPHGEPILDPNGATLYGMTREGGKKNVGVIFSYNTASNAFKTLHSFTCPKNAVPGCISKKDGASPDHGNLVQSGGTLYGLTTFGGKFGAGVAFSILTTGKKFKVLHSFGKAGSNDGQHPYGSLLLVGTTLYGTTRDGGKLNLGTAFQINTDGSAFARIHDFSGKPDGANPIDNVILVGGSLYGMTTVGGKCDFGAIFAIQLP